MRGDIFIFRESASDQCARISNLCLYLRCAQDLGEGLCDELGAVDRGVELDDDLHCRALGDDLVDLGDELGGELRGGHRGDDHCVHKLTQSEFPLLAFLKI
jgi:hypothetical protein